MIGAGWWAQGWHIPHLHRNPDVHLAAIVSASSEPKSNLNPHLESLPTLALKYGTVTFTSVTELLNDPSVGPTLDGAIVVTPHSTHFPIGEELLRFAQQRRREQQQGQQRPLHILMEKPMTTNVHSAKQLHDLVQKFQTTTTDDADNTHPIYFMLNHTANYRIQTKMARELVVGGAIGQVRHISAFLASALCGIFEDPANKGWNEPSDDMLGNGFAWGQCSHVLAWIYHVCPQLQPQTVYCDMIHSPITGADVAHAASIRCTDMQNAHVNDDDKNSKVVVVSMSGTSLLPGNEHSDPPVGKQIQLKIYGTKGAIIYCGDTANVNSGRLELRRTDTDGKVEYPLGDEYGFAFENLHMDGTGPESLQSFIQACLSNYDSNNNNNNNIYIGADSLVGLQSVQTLEAMYRSHHEKQAVQVMYYQG